MPDPTIPLREFATRRRKLLAALKRSVGLVLAGESTGHLEEVYRPHPHFEYLTGVVDEPGAVLLLDPLNPVPARQEMLFLRPLDPEVERWDGYRLEVGQALRERTGFKSMFRLGHLPRFLRDAAQRARSVACLHPLATHDQPVSPDLALARALAERIPGLEITDRTEVPLRLRCVKSAREVAMIQQAIDVTAAGFETVMNAAAPGTGEGELQVILEHAYRARGSRGPAFGTIVGAGLNSTVLHYRANDQPIEPGDLICIDSGAGWGGYGADITRTIPADGVFTDRQREVYEVVLRAQMAAIKATRQGARLAEIDRVARAVITKAGYGDFFIHSIGHHLGLETHDPAPDAPLRAGAVVTIEPGIYIPEERIGVRIEDVVLVTTEGSRNLSSKIPKTVKAVERGMKKR